MLSTLKAAFAAAKGGKKMLHQPSFFAKVNAVEEEKEKAQLVQNVARRNGQPQTTYTYARSLSREYWVCK